jgi:hypothetical protein
VVGIEDVRAEIAKLHQAAAIQQLQQRGTGGSCGSRETFGSDRAPRSTASAPHRQIGRQCWRSPVSSQSSSKGISAPAPQVRMMRAAGRPGVALRTVHSGLTSKDRPIIVVSAAAQPVPSVRFVEGFGRQHPVEEGVALVLVAGRSPVLKEGRPGRASFPPRRAWAPARHAC